jgi:hypothetical protein
MTRSPIDIYDRACIHIEAWGVSPLTAVYGRSEDIDERAYAGMAVCNGQVVMSPTWGDLYLLANEEAAAADKEPESTAFIGFVPGAWTDNIGGLEGKVRELHTVFKTNA